MPRSKIVVGPAEPDIGLRIDPLEPEPVEDFLAPHVEPADVDVGAPALERRLEQLELVAAVRRVHHHRRAGVPPARQRDERQETQRQGTRRAPRSPRVTDAPLPAAGPAGS